MLLILLNDMCLVPKLAIIHNNCNNLKHQISLIFTAMLTKKKPESIVWYCLDSCVRATTVTFWRWTSHNILPPLHFRQHSFCCSFKSCFHCLVESIFWPLNIEYVNILTHEKSVVLKGGDTRQVDPIVMTDMEHFICSSIKPLNSHHGDKISRKEDAM